MAQPLTTSRDGTPAPGTAAARPRWPRRRHEAGCPINPCRCLARAPLGELERTRRKLAQARWERDRWQRRYLIMTGRFHALERRRGWTEQYVGFRVEYRIRGWWRGVKRHARIARRTVGWSRSSGR